MKITRKSILGVGTDTSNVEFDWERPCTPNTKDGIKKKVDSVEFEVSHKRNKLRQFIQSKKEYIMCFVHFDAGTENLDGIYMSVWDEDAFLDKNIDTFILDEDEKQMLVEYAFNELREYR